jgi:hypothetical protein
MRQIYQLLGKISGIYQNLIYIFGIFLAPEKDLMLLHDGRRISRIYQLLGKKWNLLAFWKVFGNVSDPEKYIFWIYQPQSNISWIYQLLRDLMDL